MNDAYKVARKAAKEKIDIKYVDIQLRRWKGKEQGGEYYTQAREAYMSSPEWEKLRRLIMERAKDQCEGCAQAPTTEVCDAPADCRRQAADHR